VAEPAAGLIPLKREKQPGAQEACALNVRSGYSSVNSGFVTFNEQLQVFDEADEYHDHRANDSGEEEHDKYLGEKLKQYAHALSILSERGTNASRRREACSYMLH